MGRDAELINLQTLFRLCWSKTMANRSLLCRIEEFEVTPSSIVAQIVIFVNRENMKIGESSAALCQKSLRILDCWFFVRSDAVSGYGRIQGGWAGTQWSSRTRLASASNFAYYLNVDSRGVGSSFSNSSFYGLSLRCLVR